MICGRGDAFRADRDAGTRLLTLRRARERARGVPHGPVMIHCKDEGKVLCFVRRSPLLATRGRNIGNDAEQNPVPQGHSLWKLVCGLAVDVGSLAQGGRVQLTESLGFAHP